MSLAPASPIQIAPSPLVTVRAMVTGGQALKSQHVPVAVALAVPFRRVRSGPASTHPLKKPPSGPWEYSTRMPVPLEEDAQGRAGVGAGYRSALLYAWMGEITPPEQVLLKTPCASLSHRQSTSKG